MSFVTQSDVYGTLESLTWQQKTTCCTKARPCLHSCTAQAILHCVVWLWHLSWCLSSSPLSFSYFLPASLCFTNCLFLPLFAGTRAVTQSLWSAWILTLRLALSVKHVTESLHQFVLCSRNWWAACGAILLLLLCFASSIECWRGMCHTSLTSYICCLCQSCCHEQRIIYWSVGSIWQGPTWLCAPMCS